MVAQKILALGLVAGAAVAALTAGVYYGNHDAPIVVDFERGYEAAFVEAFHPRERAEGKYFRWTTDASFVVFQNLPQTGNLQLEVRIKVIRPSGMALPYLAFTANGVTVHRAAGLPGIETYLMDFPSTATRLRLGIEPDTFEAGGGRRLGVQVLSVNLVASGGPTWGAPSFWMGAATLLLFAAAIVAGFRPFVAAACSLGLGVGFCYFLAQQGVRYTNYPFRVMVLALFAALLVLGLRIVFTRRAWPAPPDRSWVLGAILLSFVLKAGALSYPLWLSSDADFQANRLTEYMGGDWYTTSVTQHQPAFRIPYPVALYAVSAPLVKLGLDRVSALESVTVLFDVMAGLALVYLAWRFLDDLRAGIVAVALYHLTPMSSYAFSAGNFTNLFALSTMVIAFAFVARAATDGGKGSILGAGIFTLLALTAHFGMLMEGAFIWPLWIVVILFLLPAPARQDLRKPLGVAIAVSFGLTALYYAGYWDLVAGQWRRALGGSDSEGAAAAGERLRFSWALVRDQFGWVLAVTSVLGAAVVLRGRALASAWHAGACVWMVATCVFFLLDLFSPLEIRYWLQLLPLASLLAGAYLSKAWGRGRLGKLAAFAALAYVTVTGSQVLIDCMIYRYHNV